MKAVVPTNPLENTVRPVSKSVPKMTLLGAVSWCIKHQAIVTFKETVPDEKGGLVTYIRIRTRHLITEASYKSLQDAVEAHIIQSERNI